jgi:hypothetical protein
LCPKVSARVWLWGVNRNLVANDIITRALKQRLHCGQSFYGVAFCLRQFGDVEGGVAERDQLLALGQFDWIEKSLIPRHQIRPL